MPDAASYAREPTKLAWGPRIRDWGYGSCRWDMYLNAIWSKSPTALEPILSDGPEAHFKSIDIPLRVKRWHPQLTVPYKQLANLAEERALNPLCMVPGAPDQVVAKVGRSSTRKLSFSQVAMETKRMLQTERKKKTDFNGHCRLMGKPRVFKTAPQVPMEKHQHKYLHRL